MWRKFFTAILFLIFFIDNQANDSVIIFYKDDCPYCREMKESIDKDVDFKEFLNQRYVVTLIDINSKDGSEIAGIYNVRAVPTILKFDETSGTTRVLKRFGSIKRLSGFLKSEIAAPVISSDKSQLLNCGNGIVERNEQCDDGNVFDNDGCSNSCKVEEGWTCSGRPSICSPLIFCGNGVVEEDEQCDDGNSVDTDDCNNSCQTNDPAYCGNGVVEGDEWCDDGNIYDNDGCNKSCEVEAGWICSGSFSQCYKYAICNNGVLEGEEQCDDGNTFNNDGCSNTCEEEVGWACTGSPSRCNTIENCGNGIVEEDEWCDDGNIYDNDGCNKSCEVEAGWICSGSFSQCYKYAICNNGVLEGEEQCDDGNTFNNDGCSNTCEEEVGWVCTGSPSRCNTIENCGNGIVEEDEQCDDGNLYDNDGCNKSCGVEEGWSCEGNPSLCESTVNVKKSDTFTCSSLTKPVYPNPFTENLNISLFLTETSDIEFFIIELKGKVANYFIKKELHQGNNNINLDLSDLLPGNYILSIKNKDNSNLFNKAVRIMKVK
jgi:cysteine-rich repeat protein